MSEQTIIFFLLICIALLIGVILYQQFAFRSGIQTKLRKISGKLKEITDTDSDERVMVFTENKELMELAAQINRLACPGCLHPCRNHTGWEPDL